MSTPIPSRAADAERAARLFGGNHFGWASVGRFLITIVVCAITLELLDAVMSGFTMYTFTDALLLALGVAILNLILWPLLITLALHLTVVFVLLSTLIFNGALVYIVGQAASGIDVSFGASIVVAIVLAVVSTLLEATLHADAESVNVRVIRRRAGRRGGIQASEVPGVILFEIDGLSEPTFQAALAGGYMPTLRGWIDDSSHKVIPWECDFSSQTGASQAGLLQGSNFDMPAFRWYEKETGRMMVSNHPKDATEIERRHSDGAGLLAIGGGAVGNMVSGDAPRTLATMSTILIRGREYDDDFFAYFGQPNGFIRTLALSFVDISREMRAARAQRKSGEQPQLGKEHRGGIYPLLRVTQTVICRDLNVATLVAHMYEGVPVAYSTFVAYDEVAHHSGIMRPDALEILRQLDGELARLERAKAQAPRPYHLVVLSDHGQTQGATFLQRYGHTLESLVNGAIDGEVRAPVSADEGAATFGVTLTEAASGDSASARTLRRATRSRTKDGVIALDEDGRAALAEREPAEEDDARALVLASGNLGLIYLLDDPERMSYERITELHPALIPALRGHEGVGFVMVRSDEHGIIAFGPRGINYLSEHRIEGEDPLVPFGPTAGWHLERHDSFPHCPDIVVNSFYDPETEEICAFEELIGAHGGLGGRQQHPFALVPTEWSDPPDAILGVEAMHRQLRTWLVETGQEVAPRTGGMHPGLQAGPGADG